LLILIFLLKMIEAHNEGIMVFYLILKYMNAKNALLDITE